MKPSDMTPTSADRLTATQSAPSAAEGPLPFIDLKAQYNRYRADIDRRIAAVLEHGRYILGPEVAELEAALSAFCGAPHSVGVSDGTTALQIAMMALGIGPGDEVITTPFTFIATGETISLLGAKPVFVDIDPQTFNIDSSLIEAAITPRTRAILPVSLYGQCADMDSIAEVALRHDLPVIEDAAQSFGATWNGRHSGNLSVLAATSFFPSKPLGCYGDGGACFTSDPGLAERMKRIRAHGQAERYQHVEVGVNGRLDTLQAAILLAKLPQFSAELDARDRVAEQYRRLIQQAGLENHGLELTHLAPQARSAHAQFTVRVPNREVIIRSLAARNVPTAVHYPLPLHRQPLYAGAYEGVSLPHAEKAAREVISLPMHPFLSEQQQERVVNALAGALT